jgi:hypothetical protein
MDVIEFVEKVCGLQLLDYQKEFLRKMQSVSRDGDYHMLQLRSGRIVIIPEERVSGDGYKSDICFVDEIECIRDKTFKLRQQEFAEKEIAKFINGIGKGAGDGL